MITAIECIEKTHMVISADDTGIIKIWDIRTFKCIQSLNFGLKTKIDKLISMHNRGKLCFIGARINVISFDNKESSKTYDNTKKSELYPVKVLI